MESLARAACWHLAVDHVPGRRAAASCRTMARQPRVHGTVAAADRRCVCRRTSLPRAGLRLPRHVQLRQGAREGRDRWTGTDRAASWGCRCRWVSSQSRSPFPRTIGPSLSGGPAGSPVSDHRPDTARRSIPAPRCVRRAATCHVRRGCRLGPRACSCTVLEAFESSTGAPAPGHRQPWRCADAPPGRVHGSSSTPHSTRMVSRGARCTRH